MTKSRDLGNVAQTVAVNLPTSLGTAGQSLVVNSGADGLEFGAASGGSGVTTYTNKTAIDAVSSPSEGDLAYDLAADELYIRTTSAWERVSIGVDESPIITTEPATTHTLNTDGSTSTVTMVAEDPEGFGITYGIAYPTANNALPDQLATATSINQSTGVFTFDPSTNTSHQGDVKVRLSASDGISTTTRFCTLTLGFTVTVDYLVIGGGGGGGLRHGGGGGAGGYIYATGQTLNSSTTYTITVGTGGAGGSGATPVAGTDGNDSSISATGFTTVTAIGGGGGGTSAAGGDGGSGGGGGYSGVTAGSGTSGQGNDGGTGHSNAPYHAGGGGGAGGAGANAGSIGGAGGDGLQNSITGTALYYAGGGGGGTYNTSGTSAGGSGVGGSGSSQQNTAGTPTANTGSGGGGNGGSGGSATYNGTATAGADGVVIIRTLSSAVSTTGSPTVTTDGSYNIYKFTASGTITF